jgi:hypothetical protein
VTGRVVLGRYSRRIVSQVNVKRPSIAQRLVRTDAVVDVAKAGGLHRQRAAVVARGAADMLALEGAEDAFGNAVGLG